MKKRLTFNCWNCSQPYSLLREIEGCPKLTVECPYCGKEGIADLNPYRDNLVVVFRGEKSTNSQIGGGLEMSDNISTTPPDA
jgi:uncharacterized Zn finger protein